MLCYADDKWVIKDLFFFNFIYTYYHSFEIRPDGSTRDWNRAGLMKKLEKSWPGVTQPTRLTRQNPVKNSVATCCFFFY